MTQPSVPGKSIWSCCVRAKGQTRKINFRALARPAAAIGAGAVAFGCLLAAVISEPLHPVAAVVASLLGWLACYAYSLQRECRHLARCCKIVDNGLAAVPSCAESHSVDVNHSSQSVFSETVDLDMTTNSGMLTLFTPRDRHGKTAHTMDTVLTSALVSEYLRTAMMLKKYQSKYGLLPGAPQCDPGFAQALLDGLNTVPPEAQQQPPPQAQPQYQPQQPVPPITSMPATAAPEPRSPEPRLRAPSPGPIRTSPSTSARRALPTIDLIAPTAGQPTPTQPTPTQPTPTQPVYNMDVSGPAWLRQVHRAVA